jgi:hypothetical protein
MHSTHNLPEVHDICLTLFFVLLIIAIVIQQLLIAIAWKPITIFFLRKTYSKVELLA